MRRGAGETPDGLTRAGLRDTLALLARVVLPTLAKGVLVRRPRVVALAERLDLDAAAVRCLQRLCRDHGPGPLLLAIPGRPQAVLLSPDHVHRVLAGAPEPFAPGTLEKHAALATFEPRVSLVPRPPERVTRRRRNDAALESDRRRHSCAGAFRAAIDAEARRMIEAGPALTWDRFGAGWHAAARQIVLGPGAREDHALTDALTRLRAAGNRAFLHPGRPRLRRRFRARLAAYLERPADGCLAAGIAERPGAEAAPADQAAHWLFAFDAAGLATYRALALLAAHPEAAARARAEMAAATRDGVPDLPILRACLLESVRLWPTTPAILRATTRPVEWAGGTMPARTRILIYVPYFHRDDARLPCAHRFEPGLWLDPRSRAGWPLIPFSEGPGICPARHLVPLVGSLMLAALLRGHRIRLADPARLAPGAPLPGTLDPFTLRFILEPDAAV